VASKATVTVAISKIDGTYVDISDERAKQGKGKIYTCPICGCDMHSRHYINGQRADHFVHSSTDTETSAEITNRCGATPESNLHLRCKLRIQNAERMFIPERSRDYQTSGHIHKRILADGQVYSTSDIQLEQSILDIRPDVILNIGDEKILVEIKVAHGIGQAKLEKIKETGLSTIEIDLSKIDRNITNEELDKILLGESELKTFVYDCRLEEAHKDLLNISGTYMVNKAGNIEYCSSLGMGGFPVTECYKCKYCISVKDYYGHISVTCSGINDIENYIDIPKPKAELLEEKVKKHRKKRAKTEKETGEIKEEEPKADVELTYDILPEAVSETHSEIPVILKESGEPMTLEELRHHMTDMSTRGKLVPYRGEDGRHICPYCGESMGDVRFGEQSSTAAWYRCDQEHNWGGSFVYPAKDNGTAKCDGCGAPAELYGTNGNNKLVPHFFRCTRGCGVNTKVREEYISPDEDRL
jgi:hypothetical protein